MFGPCQLLDLRDSGVFGDLRLRSGLLVFGVDESHVGQSDEGQNVAQVRFLIIKTFGRSTGVVRATA